MQSFNDPIDGTNAGSPGSGSGSTGAGGTTGGSTGGLEGGTTESGTGGLGTGTGGITGGVGGGMGGYGGSTGGTTDGGTTGGTTGGYSGSTGETGGAGGYGGSTGGTADGGMGGYGGGTTGGYSGSTGETGGAGDDFDLHEPAYRRHYTTVGTETPGTTGTYDEARTGYAAGHAAASNPAYADRTYEEVEVDLERSVGSERVREFARHAYEWKGVIAGVALAAAGGYWASRKLASAASELSEEEERDCRTYYDMHPVRGSGVPYSQARTVYVLGYVAGRNPEYAGRTYDDVEPHLRGGYTGRGAGNYDTLRDFGRRGYERGTTRGSV